MAFVDVDEKWMAKALQLAERGIYTTSPNPRVGCVIVRDGVCVGEGWHHQAGTPHAEVHALRMAADLAQGATAYVTLEPCSHFGRTPPCADALITAGVKRVVAAMTDPNPLVAGQGLARLAAAGIEVAVGVLQAPAMQLNRGFISRMTRKIPWVTLKIAASLDGKTALKNGESQWITGPAARQDVHQLRARHCAIMTGSGTVIADDPQLTVRNFETIRQPKRVVIDSKLKTAATAKIYQQQDVAQTYLYTTNQTPAQQQAFSNQGVKVIALPATAAFHVDLSQVLTHLAAEGMNEVMVEAGATLNAVLLQSGLIDEVVLYLAPTFLGDSAQGLFAGIELATLTQQYRFTVNDIRALGQDLRLTLTPAMASALPI